MARADPEDSQGQFGASSQAKVAGSGLPDSAVLVGSAGRDVELDRRRVGRTDIPSVWPHREIRWAAALASDEGVQAAAAAASGRGILAEPLARRVTAIMLTCGTYDASGESAFSVGVPRKSGVAGAIMGVVPDRPGLCIWSPGLDPSGNSVVGRVALHGSVERCGLSIL